MQVLYFTALLGSSLVLKKGHSLQNGLCRTFVEVVPLV